MSDDDEGSGITGKLIKWSIILLLTGLTGGTFLIIYLGWKYVKLCVLFYFKALYLIIRFPIWLFIQLPAYYIGVSFHKISHAFSKAYGVIMAKKKRYGLLFGILFVMMLYLFLPRNVDAAMSFLTDATLILPFLVLIPFIITFTIALISSHFRMPDIARKKMPGGLNTGMKGRTATAGAAAAAAGQAGLQAYNSVEGDNLNEKMENAQEAANVAKGGASKAKNIAGEAAEGEGLAVAEGETILAGDMVATLEGMPLIGGMLTGAGEAAGAAGAVGGSVAASGGTVLLALLLAFLGFIVISIILSALIFWVAGIVIPMIIGPLVGPIMGALGLGQAYGNWMGSEIANNVMPQINLEAETRMIQQAGAKIGCFMKGPACIRQWRMNHTSRPGSEDVGEKYRLKVNEFSAGGQGGIDVAYKKPTYNVPISFLLLNTRHGLKGIRARDVSYRVTIVDSKRTGKKAYCSTGWNNVSSAYGGVRSGTILPGTSFSPTINQLDSLTIEKCEMIQPALGHDFTAKLDVKYDYSSQSTLYVEAMSRENMRDEKITPEFKKSKTADTPVETFLNVKAPVTFIQRDDTRAIPFTVKVGTATDRLDVEYRVHPEDFEVIDSSKTTETGACIGLTPDSGNNRYRLSDRTQKRMDERINNSDLTTWFDKAKNPSPARCTFELQNPRSISPTGETLTFRVDANYTVNIEKTSDPFEVKNTRCSRFECPMLFYLKPHEFQNVISTSQDFPPKKWKNEYTNPRLTDNYKKWKYAVCDGIDADNGCSAMEEYKAFYGADEVTQGIQEDDVAVKWGESTISDEKIFSCKLRGDPGLIDKEAVGIEVEKLKEVVNTEPDAGVDNWKRLHYTGSGEFEVIEYAVSISDSGGIPYLAEKKVTWHFKAGNCKDGEDGYGPEFQLVNEDVEWNGAIPAGVDFAGDLAGAVADAAVTTVAGGAELATGVGEGAVYLASNSAETLEDQATIEEQPDEDEVSN